MSPKAISCVFLNKRPRNDGWDPEDGQRPGRNAGPARGCGAQCRAQDADRDGDHPDEGRMPDQAPTEVELCEANASMDEAARELYELFKERAEAQEFGPLGLPPIHPHPAPRW